MSGGGPGLVLMLVLGLGLPPNKDRVRVNSNPINSTHGGFCNAQASLMDSLLIFKL